jgi:hypothetical protein
VRALRDVVSATRCDAAVLLASVLLGLDASPAVSVEIRET